MYVREHSHVYKVLGDPQSNWEAIGKDPTQALTAAVMTPSTQF